MMYGFKISLKLYVITSRKYLAQEVRVGTFTQTGNGTRSENKNPSLVDSNGIFDRECYLSSDDVRYSKDKISTKKNIDILTNNKISYN